MDCRTLGWRAPVRLAPQATSANSSTAAAIAIPGSTSTPSPWCPRCRFWMKAWPSMIMLAVRSEAPQGAKPGLQASVVSFDPIVGISSGAVKCGRQEFRNDSDQGVGSIGGDLSRLAVGGDRTGREHVDDQSVVLNCSVDVPPRPGELHVGLIDEPVTTDAVATRPGRIHQQRREPLDPSLQDHMVDIDTPLGEESLEIPVGESVAQVPTHSDHNDLGRKPESGGRRPGRLDGWDETGMHHLDSLVHQWPGSEARGAERGRARCNSAPARTSRGPVATDPSGRTSRRRRSPSSAWSRCYDRSIFDRAPSN